MYISTHMQGGSAIQQQRGNGVNSPRIRAGSLYAHPLDSLLSPHPIYHHA